MSFFTKYFALAIIVTLVIVVWMEVGREKDIRNCAFAQGIQYAVNHVVNEKGEHLFAVPVLEGDRKAYARINETI